MKQLIWLFCFWTATIVLVGCSGCSQGIQDSLRNSEDFSVVSYNAQEFFDGINDGVEYEDYRKGNWNIEAYKQRLERLCGLIILLKADVFVLEEIENEGILQDISNFLAGSSWKQKDLLNYSCFAKEPGAAIGVAVFSKFPLRDVKLHNLDIRTESRNMPSMRPILQVELEMKDRSICVLANHWKSKSGGEEETEVWRNWQENLLADILLREMEQGQIDFVVCGDFNRDILEFSHEGNKVFFRCHNSEEKNNAPVCFLKTPWLNEEGIFTTKEGSYFFNKDWERIDHIFYGGRLFCKSFGPQINALWTDEEGHPYEYRLQNGKGYSDHLPVKAVLSWNE